METTTPKSSTIPPKVNNTSRPPPFVRSHAQRPLGRTLIVQTEFVYTPLDIDTHSPPLTPSSSLSLSKSSSSSSSSSISSSTSPLPATVHLRGDWNGWNDIPMTRESASLWSVVTPVPTGVRRFRFIVDGTPTASPRHPIVSRDEDPHTGECNIIADGCFDDGENGDGDNEGNTLHWRNVTGPPHYSHHIKYPPSKSATMAWRFGTNKHHIVLQPPHGKSATPSAWQHFLRDALRTLGIVVELQPDTDTDDETTAAADALISMGGNVPLVQSDEDDVIDAAGFMLPCTMRTPKRTLLAYIANIGFVGFIVVAVSSYLIGIALYSLVVLR